jgi:signal transduction histidine kinase
VLSLRGQSVRRQIVSLSIFASSTALLLACAAFLAYEVLTFRTAMVRNLATHAEVIAANSTAAILFQDAKSAAETLSALRAEPHIMFVEIRTPEGKSFATYLRRDLTSPPAAVAILDSSGYVFAREMLVLTHPILSDGLLVARLHIYSDLRARDARVLRYLGITALILFLSLVAGLLMSTRLQRSISEPILRLVAAARTVSDRKDYSVRVDSAERGEVALLGRTFNEMLDQIARQDADLRLAVAARDEFLSIASHELKTPLTPLLLQVQRLQATLRQTDAPSPTKLASGLEMMDRQVARLTKLVSNLLDISRITSQRLQLERETLDLGTLVREVVARFQHELTRAGCAVTLHAPDGMTGLWDKSRLDQVITNLLSNAMKYGSGKPIEIWVEGDVGVARLRIQDQGIGIAPEDQARIFQRFERAVSVHSYGGFGLGLWIVAQIVDAVGGKIAVNSSPGSGATFIVDLPRHPVEKRADARAV